jgi:hypothetical protein
MFSPKNWWNIWPTGDFRKATPPECRGSARNTNRRQRNERQRPEERAAAALQIGLGFAHDVAGDELRRVLEHVDEAVQLAQDVVRDVARGARFAVQEDRDLGVAAADFLTKARSSAIVSSGPVASSSSSIDRMKREARSAAGRTKSGRRSWSRPALPSPPS